MNGHSIPCRLTERGGSHFLLIVKEVRKQLRWRPGDFIAARVIGEKLILERIPCETLAKIRTGEAVLRDEV